MHVSKGVRAGQPLILTSWQQELLTSLYERRDDGLLRYRRSLIGLARKNGKSLLGTVIALVGLIEGEPGAEVYSAAGDRQQARVVFNEAKWQITQSPALSGVCKVYRDVVEVPSTGAIYRVLSSDAKLQQGLNPSTVVFDELHVQGSNSDLWDALTLGSGARKDPMIVSITTAGFDLDTVCGRLYNYGKEIVAGIKLDERFGFWWWEAPADCEISDRDAWAIANPNLAEGLLDIEDMEISMMQTAETAMRRYRLNQWVRTDGESWLPKGAWELCRSDDELDPTVPVFVGIDMALKHDSIAVVVAQLQESGRVVTRAKIWYPQDGIMDVSAVEQHIRDLGSQFTVQEFAYDPAFFQRSAEAMSDEGFTMVEFSQSTSRMVPACGTLYEYIVNGRLAHNGDPVFTDQVMSAAQRSTDMGWRLSKGKSKRKIDAAIALAMAVDRATRKTDAIPEPGFFVV